MSSVQLLLSWYWPAAGPPRRDASGVLQLLHGECCKGENHDDDKELLHGGQCRGAPPLIPLPAREESRNCGTGTTDEKVEIVQLGGVWPVSQRSMLTIRQVNTTSGREGTEVDQLLVRCGATSAMVREVEPNSVPSSSLRNETTTR